MKNIPLFKVFMADTAPQKVAEVLTSGFIGQGPKVAELETKLASYFGVDTSHLLTFNSATSAEHLAYHILKNPQTYKVDWNN